MNSTIKAAPVVRRGGREISTADLEIGQRPSIDLDGDIGLDVRQNEEIAAVDTPLEKDDFAALAFAEEPVTIRLERSSEKYAPMHVPAWVNGKGAEVFDNGRWVEVTYLPVGKPVTTKRKYVEVLVRAKPDDVQTIHEDATAERPRNELIRNTRSAFPLTILQDKNPKGHEWLTRLMAEG